MSSDDIVYTFFERQGGGPGSGEQREVAQVQFNCLAGKPTRMGEARKSKKEAKNAVAEAVLADADFLANMILADGKKAGDGAAAAAGTPDKKKRPKKKAKKAPKANATEPEPVAEADGKPRINVADLELGQEVSGVVRGGNSGGFYVDVGANIDAYLPASELAPGFPKTVMIRSGDNVTGRVLWKEENLTRFWITRLPGDLERPTKEKFDFNASSFAGISHDEWLEGKVVAMTFDHCTVEVTPPGGGAPVAGTLEKSWFTPEFFDEAKLGGAVRVRVKRLGPTGRLDLTMVEGGAHVLSDMAIGQKLKGKVNNRLGPAGKVLGWFVDVGAEKDAFLDVEESSDGWPNSRPSPRLRPGDEVEVRVLKMEGGKLWVTRRSGDLARPEFQSYTNKGSVEQFASVVGKDEWLEGQVIRMLPPGQVFVKTKAPGGEEAVGLLNIKDATKAFLDEACPGMLIKVRVKKVDVARKRFVLTMRTPAAASPSPAEAAEEGEEVTAADAQATEEASRPQAAEQKPEEEKEEEVKSPEPSPEAGSEPAPDAPEPTTTTTTTTEQKDLLSFIMR